MAQDLTRTLEHTRDLREYLHTPFYCEENVYHLVDRLNRDPVHPRAAPSAQQLQLEADQRGSGQTHDERNIPTPPPQVGRQTFAVFISNPDRRCVLFHQKAAPEDRNYVVWDYHVVAATVDHASDDSVTMQIWDLDSTLGTPVMFEDYIQHTFLPDIYDEDGCLEVLPDIKAPRFRVVPADLFLRYFASDRSHMLVPAEDGRQGPSYLQPPPVWDAIVSPGARTWAVSNNLWSKYLNMTLPSPRDGTLPSGRPPTDESESHPSHVDWEDWENHGSIYGQVMSLSTFADGVWWR